MYIYICKYIWRSLDVFAAGRDRCSRKYSWRSLAAGRDRCSRRSRQLKAKEKEKENIATDDLRTIATISNNAALIIFH